MEEDFIIAKVKEQELELLNDQEPKLGHQKRFAKKLAHKNKREFNSFPLMKMVASIALILSVFMIGKISAPDETQLEIASFSLYFTSLIEEKSEALERYTSQEERLIILDALSELEELEADATTLIKDLNTGGDSKQIIKAMMVNYHTRLQVLDQLTKELNELKQ